MDNVLVKQKRYEGKYVAMPSFTDHKVITSGSDPDKAMKSALKKGITDPVIMFIPKDGMTYIY
jgi:hypothetical protein